MTYFDKGAVSAVSMGLGRQFVLLADEDLISLVKGSDAEALAQSWRNSQGEQVREALKTLPPEQLKILELAYFSGYTHVEIAELLGLPLGTVKGRMRLGLNKIRDYSDGLKLP